MRSLKKVLLLVFVYLLTPFLNFSNHVIKIDDKEESFDFLKYASYYEDKDRNLNVNQVHKLNDEFVYFDDISPKTGFSDSWFWIKLEAKNISDFEKQMVININFPTLSVVEFYEFEDDILKREVITGDKHIFSSRKVETNSYSFYLIMKPESNYTVYLKLSNEGNAIRFPIELTSTHQFLLNQSTSKSIDGFAYGLFLFVFLFNLILYFTLKETLYLWYSFYCILFSFFLFIMDGYSFKHFWPNSPYLADHLAVFIVSFANVFLLVFTQKFLGYKTLNKKIWLFNEIFKIIFILLAVIALVRQYEIHALAQKAANILSFSAMIFIVFASIYALLKGSLYARYFLISFIILITSVILYVFRNAGIIPDNLFSEYGLKAGFSIEVILLSVAVTDRFKRIRDRTQAKLEQMVKDRTKEIEEQKDVIEIEKDKSDKLLHNILPLKVAKDLKEKGKTEPESFENVSVFFSDFVGFTKMASNLEPKKLIIELNELFTRFDEIMEKHHCERLKTIGDGYLSVCGMPAPNENHAENMIDAALEIKEFMNERNKTAEHEMMLRIGIHSGQVVGGIVGIKKYAYDVFGDTINTTSRMESLSEPMKINISEFTFKLIKDKYEFVKRPLLEAKGKGKLQTYFVTGKI
jgi:class 3 adenylate cyclase